MHGADVVRRCDYRVCGRHCDTQCQRSRPVLERRVHFAEQRDEVVSIFNVHLETMS